MLLSFTLNVFQDVSCSLLSCASLLKDLLIVNDYLLYTNPTPDFAASINLAVPKPPEQSAPTRH
jgi:hypothetical protein